MSSSSGMPDKAKATQPTLDDGKSGERSKTKKWGDVMAEALMISATKRWSELKPKLTELMCLDKIACDQSAEYHFLLGQNEVEMTLDAALRAASHFDKAISLAPMHPGAHTYRAYLFNLEKAKMRALAHITIAIGADPNSATAYCTRAHTFLLCKEFPAAIIDIEKALSLDDQDGWNHHIRGWIHQDMEEYGAAIKCFETAARLCPRTCTNDRLNACRRKIEEQHKRVLNLQTQIADLQKQKDDVERKLHTMLTVSSAKQPPVQQPNQLPAESKLQPPQTGSESKSSGAESKVQTAAPQPTETGSETKVAQPPQTWAETKVQTPAPPPQTVSESKVQTPAPQPPQTASEAASESKVAQPLQTASESKVTQPQAVSNAVQMTAPAQAVSNAGSKLQMTAPPQAVSNFGSEVTIVRRDPIPNSDSDSDSDLDIVTSAEAAATPKTTP